MLDLGREELLGVLGVKQLAVAHRLEEPHEVGRGHVGTAVGRADRRVAVDVRAPETVDEIPALRDAGGGLTAIVEARVEHPEAGEDLVEDVLAVAHARDLLDREAREHVADVAVAAVHAGLGERLLVSELRQEVLRLDDRVVRGVAEELLVALARLLVGVIRDAARVGQQVQQRHLRADRRALEVDVVVDRGLEVELALADQVEHRDAREELRDRRGVEARVHRVRDAPARRRETGRRFVEGRVAALDEHRAAEVVVGEERVEARGIHTCEPS